MTSKDIVAQLRQIDAELEGERMSAAADERIGALVAAHGSSAAAVGASMKLAWLGAAAGAVGAVALAIATLPPEAKETSTLPTAGGFTVVAGDVRATSGGEEVACRSARCTLRASDIAAELTVRRNTRVGRAAGGDVRLLSGSASVHVDRSRSGADPTATSVKFYVSHGAVEVLGTRFWLWQDQAGGQIALHEGSVRFVATDGRARNVAPGERLSWPLPVVTTADKTESRRETAPPAKTPPRGIKRSRRKLDKRAVESLVQRVAQRRSQGRYADAARLLTENLPRIGTRSTRERLSFELAAILTDHLRDAARACQRWRAHARMFAGGRYATEVARAMDRLGCNTP